MTIDIEYGHGNVSIITERNVSCEFLYLSIKLCSKQRRRFHIGQVVITGKDLDFGFNPAHSYSTRLCTQTEPDQRSFLAYQAVTTKQVNLSTSEDRFLHGEMNGYWSLNKQESILKHWIGQWSTVPRRLTAGIYVSWREYAAVYRFSVTIVFKSKRATDCFVGSIAFGALFFTRDELLRNFVKLVECLSCYWGAR